MSNLQERRQNYQTFLKKRESNKDKEPPKYILEKNPRNNRKTKKLNPRWTAWSKRQKNKEIDKKVDKYVKDRKVTINKDLTKDNSKKKKVVKKTDNTQQTNTPNTTKPKYKQVTQAELDKKIAENKKGKETLKAKPKKMHAIERENRKRFGDAHVDKLKARYAEFKAKRKKKKKEKKS